MIKPREKVMIAGDPTLPVTPASASEMSSYGITVGFAPGFESLANITPQLDTTSSPGNVSQTGMIWLNDTQSGIAGQVERPTDAALAIAVLQPLVDSGQLNADAIVNINCERPHHDDLVSAMAFDATQAQIDDWNASRDSWIAIVEGVKAQFPSMKVGIWGLPYVPASPAMMSASAPVGSWTIPALLGTGAYSNEAARVANEDAYKEEMASRLLPVIQASDYINGRVYPNYGYRADGESGGALNWPPTSSGTDYGRSRDQAYMDVVLEIGSRLQTMTGKPLYASMKPAWSAHDANAAFWKDELIEEGIWKGIVDDVCRHGVDGIYVWWSYRLLDYAFSTTPETRDQSNGFDPVSVRELFRLSWVDDRGDPATLDIQDEAYWTDAANKASAYDMVASKMAERMKVTSDAAVRASMRYAARASTLAALA